MNEESGLMFRMKASLFAHNKYQKLGPQISWNGLED